MEHFNTTHIVLFNSSFENVTDGARQPWREKLILSYKVFLGFAVFIITMGMGCNINVPDIRLHLRRPVGLVIGAVGQFGMLPLLAFGLAHAMKLNHLEAIGIMLVNTCPGGNLSNFFTFLSKGDVSLSVVMTTASTILSFGMMPLNLWLYCRSWTSDKTVIPYVNIVITLASILVPVAIGMLIKWKSVKTAKLVEKIGSIGGSVLIILVVSLQIYLYPAMWDSSWKVRLLCFALPVIGFICSYALAAVLKQDPRICRTIGIETGHQNVSMALAINMLSFSEDVVAVVGVPALMYALSMTIEGFIVSGIIRLIDYCLEKRRDVNFHTTDKHNDSDLDCDTTV